MSATRRLTGRRWLAHDADPLADASAGSAGEARLREARASYERVLALEGVPQGILEATAEVVVRRRREAREAVAKEAAAAAAAAEKAKQEAEKAAAADKAAASKGKGADAAKAKGKPAGLKAAAGKAVTVKAAANALGKGPKKEVAGSGAAAAKALAATATAPSTLVAAPAATAPAAAASAPAAASSTADATAAVDAATPRRIMPSASAGGPESATDDDAVSVEELTEAVAQAKADRAASSAADASPPEAGVSNPRSVSGCPGFHLVATATSIWFWLLFDCHTTAPHLPSRFAGGRASRSRAHQPRPRRAARAVARRARGGARRR